jgi:hypothetical protein
MIPDGQFIIDRLCSCSVFEFAGAAPFAPFEKVRVLTLPFGPFPLCLLVFLPLPLQFGGGKCCEIRSNARHSGKQYSSAEPFTEWTVPAISQKLD